MAVGMKQLASIEEAYQYVKLDQNLRKLQRWHNDPRWQFDEEAVGVKQLYYKKSGHKSSKMYIADPVTPPRGTSNKLTSRFPNHDGGNKVENPSMPSCVHPYLSGTMPYVYNPFSTAPPVATRIQLGNYGPVG